MLARADARSPSAAHSAANLPKDYQAPSTLSLIALIAEQRPTAACHA